MEDRIIPESKKTRYYPALDGVRTIAVAMVFTVHFIPRIMPYGWLGVQIFFVLSGFLITGILYDTRNDKHRYKNFYMRRALRIFPLYYGFLFAGATVLLLTHGHGPECFWLWFVYLQNFFWIATHGASGDILTTGGGHAFAAVGHLWSLAVEEQFYFLWPVLIFSVKDRRRLMQLCCTFIVFRLLLAAYWQIHLPTPILLLGLTYRMLPTQADGFLMGGLLALWIRGTPSSYIQNQSGILAATGISLYAALLIALHLHPGLIAGGDVFDYRSAFQSTIGLPLSNLVSLFLIAAAIQSGTWAYHLCNLAPMRSLGRVSYGLYLFHLPVFVLTGNLLLKGFNHFHVIHGKNAGQALIATLLTTLISYASFHLYEKRFLLLKNRFTSIQGASEKKLAAHSL